MARIHPTAIVEAGAELAEDVTIGPFCLVGPNVKLAAGVVLVSHVVVEGHTTVGPRTRIHAHCVIGGAPQHLKHAGEPTTLTIGADNILREQVTMSTGTVLGGGRTVVGDKNFIMAACHVGHDCVVGNETVMANCALLAGHSEVGNYVVLGGHSAIHQFVRVGSYAMVSAMTGVADDIIPFGTAYPYDNPRAFLAGLNLIGMKRRGFTNEQIQTLRKVYDRLFAPGASVAERAEAIARDYPGDTGVAEIVEFVRRAKARKICLPYVGRATPG